VTVPEPTGPPTTPGATPNPGPDGLAILLVDEAGRPLPGACFAVGLGLRGPELPPTLAGLDTSILRTSVRGVELCDEADGQRDGAIVVRGALAGLLRDVAVVLATPTTGEELQPLLGRLWVTIDLRQTRLADALGGGPTDRTYPTVVITLADVMVGWGLRVVNQAPGPGPSSPPGSPSDPIPPAGDGTDISA